MYIHEITCISKIGKTYNKKVSVSSVKIKRSWCDIQNIRKVNKRFNLQCTTATPTPPPTPTPRIVLKAWSFSSSTVSIFSKGNAWLIFQISPATSCSLLSNHSPHLVESSCMHFDRTGTPSVSIVKWDLKSLRLSFISWNCRKISSNTFPWS